VLNLLVAFIVAGIVVLLVGESAARLGDDPGSFGRPQYRLHALFLDLFIFTGLAVAVALHAGLFNIGGEGQAFVGGLGVGIVALALDKVVPWYITFPVAIAASALFGALWAFIPAYLQAYRGSHIVITTIMFNYIAGSLMVFMLNGPLKPLGSMAPQTRPFEVGAQLPKLN
jgi:simple sugar transport system permease protein